MWKKKIKGKNTYLLNLIHYFCSKNFNKKNKLYGKYNL